MYKALGIIITAGAIIVACGKQESSSTKNSLADKMTAQAKAKKNGPDCDSKAKKLTPEIGKTPDGKYCRYTYREVGSSAPNVNQISANGKTYSWHSGGATEVDQTNFKVSKSGQVQARDGKLRWQDVGKRGQSQNSGGQTYGVCSPSQPKTTCDSQGRAWGWENNNSCRLPNKDSEC